MIDGVYVMRKLGKKWILVGLLVVAVVIAGIFLTRIDPKKYYTNSFYNMKNYFIAFLLSIF